MKAGSRRFAFLILCISASPAFADEAGEALIRSFIDRIDKHDAWSATATRISSEGSATIVEGLKIARTDGAVSLEATGLRFDKLAENTAGGIAIDSFAANALTLGGGPWRFAIPQAAGRGIATPGFGGWSFDPKAPITSLARFYTGLAASEFDEIVIPKAEFSQEITVEGGGGPAAVRASYVNFRLERLKKGTLASQSIERIESVTTGAAPEAVTTIFEGLSAKTVDLAAFAHVFDPAAYAGGKGDGLWKAAFEDATYGKITVRTGDREAFTAGPISTARWQLRQTPEPVAPLLDDLLAGSPDDAKVEDFLERHIAGLLGWFKVGMISVKDVSAYPPEGGKLALASASIEDLSVHSMARFALNGFSAHSPHLAAKFQAFELGGVVWPSLSAIITLAELEEARSQGSPVDPLLIDKATSGFMNVLPRIGKLSISGVEVGVPGAEPFRLGEYLATSEGGTALLPRTAKAKLSAIVIPRNLLHIVPESGQIFDSLGYSELVIDGEGESDHDEASGRYTGSGRLTVKEAGSLSLAHRVGGLTLERMKAVMAPFAMSASGDPDEAQLIAAAGPISIDGFTLRFDDASLTRRLLPFIAKMQGMDEATLIANTTALLQLALTPLGNQAFTSEVVNSVGTFLKDPKSLTIALRPAQPVTIRELMALDPSKPGAAIGLLGVHVTAND
jgi:hypothetical protein